MPSFAQVKVYSQILGEAKIRSLIPNATVSEPVRLGDISQDLKNQVGLIVVLDGGELTSLSSVAYEVLRALQLGVRVYGGSGFGAHLAVETIDYGTVGYGQVFDWLMEKKVTANRDWGVSVRSADAIAVLKKVRSDLSKIARDNDSHQKNLTNIFRGGFEKYWKAGGL